VFYFSSDSTTDMIKSWRQGIELDSKYKAGIFKYLAYILLWRASLRMKESITRVKNLLLRISVSSAIILLTMVMEFIIT
jgi:hypothetical protein